MTVAALVFDLLVLAIIACFVPLGIWRGGVREACVTAGVGVGLAVAGEVAVGWGNGLATISGLADGDGAVVVAVAALWVCAVLIGYGGAAIVVAGRDQSLVTRLVGGILAGINGASLVGWSLTFVWRHRLDADPARLDGLGPVTSALMRHSDWLLVLSVAALGAATVGGLLWRGAAEPAVWGAPATADPDSHARGVTDRSTLPPRLPRSADLGKVEPIPEERPDWTAFRPVRAADPSGARDHGGGAFGPLPSFGVAPPGPPDDAGWQPGPPRSSTTDGAPRSQPWRAPDRPAPPSYAGPPQHPSGSIPEGPARPTERAAPLPARPSSRPGEDVVSEWLRRGTAPAATDSSGAADPPGTGDQISDDNGGKKPSATFPWLIERGDDDDS